MIPMSASCVALVTVILTDIVRWFVASMWQDAATTQRTVVLRRNDVQRHDALIRLTILNLRGLSVNGVVWLSSACLRVASHKSNGTRLRFGWPHA